MMLLPIGHEEDSVRRWPWVSIAIVVLCVVFHLVSDQSREVARERVEQTMREALEYYFLHPHLEVDRRLVPFAPAVDAIYDDYLSAGEEAEEGFVEDSPFARPRGEPSVREQQRELDRLTAAYIEALEQMPEYRWGLVPADHDAGDYLSSIFMHGGWLHLLGNLLFLWLAGPSLEDRWGRPFFLTFYLATGVLANLLWVARFPESQVPLVGASGTIAGLMGAFAIRYWNTRIRMFYFLFWLLPLRVWTGTFNAPAWLMLGLWVGREFFWADATDALMKNVGGGTAYWVHVWGFAFGFVVAGLVRYLKLEERVFQPKIESRLGAEVNQPLEDAHAQRLAGQPEEAWKTLEQALRRRPNDVDAALALWDLALELGRTERAAPAFQRAIHQELRKGEHDVALAHWRELCDHVEEPPLDLDLRLRLAEGYLLQGCDEEAAELLAEVHETVDPELPVGLLSRLARAAAISRSASGIMLAKMALDREDLAEEVRQQLGEALDDIRVYGLRPRPSPEPEVVEEEDPHAPLPVSEAPEVVRSLRVMAAVPRRLDGEKIALEVQGKGGKVLALSKVQAVAAASIEGEAAPYVVIDLLIDPPWGERPELRTVRLKSADFDAAALVTTEEATPLEALRAFISDLVAVSEATPMPDLQAACGEPFYRFDSVGEYEQMVLGVAG